MRKNSTRLDISLVEMGLAETRNRAQALIMAGNVHVNGQTVYKSGTLIVPDDEITVNKTKEWASRGAKKLLRAFEVFDLNAKDKICADFGASTGGFTDVLLSKEAKRVYAVDVGYGQLLWRLASDSRVVVMDRTNARYLTHNDFPEKIELSVCDVSFISLKLILPVLNDITDEAIVLIKPQFEAGRKNGKMSRGVVRDKSVHAEVLLDISDFIRTDTGFSIAGMTHSPVKGPEGNIEFLCWLNRENPGYSFEPCEIAEAAHRELSHTQKEKLR